MAIEKKIDLEEAITSVQMPDGEESIEVEIDDDVELEAAEAMGMFDDMEDNMMVDDHDANLAEAIPEDELQHVASELYDGYIRDKESR